MKQRHEAEDVVESINEELFDSGIDDINLTYVSNGTSCKITFDGTLWYNDDDPRELMPDDIELESHIWKQFAEVIGKLNKIRKIKIAQL